MGLLIVAQALLVPIATATGVQVGKNGDDYTTEGGEIVVCTPQKNQSTTPPDNMCDDDHSIHIGTYDHDDDPSWAVWDFDVPKEACLKDEEFRIFSRLQINGPTNGDNGDREEGWKGKAMTSNNWQNENYVALKIKDHDSSAYEWLDATDHFHFFPNNLGRYGSIDAEDDGYNFRNYASEWIPTDGEIPRTGEDGQYLSDLNSNGLSTVSVKLINHPLNNRNDNPNSANPNYRDNLRTEVAEIGIMYQNETTRPVNPSNTTFSTSTSADKGPFAGVNQWSRNRAFDISWTGSNAARDDCGFEKLELQFRTHNSTTRHYLWTSDSPNGKNKLYIPNNPGEYDLHVRAVDINGNKGNWTKLEGVFQWDDVAPVTQTPTALNVWYSMVGNNIPQLSWTPWVDAHSGMSKYTLTIDGVNSWSHIQAVSNPIPTTYSWTPTIGDRTLLSQPSFCGQNTFRLTGEDSTNVPRRNSALVTVKIDTCKPWVGSISQPVGGWFTTNYPSLSFQSPVDLHSGVASCFLSLGQVNLTVPLSTCTSAQPVYSTYIPDGVHYVILGACDLAGNCNSSTTTVKVDSTAPHLDTFSSNTHQPGIWSNTSQFGIGFSLNDGGTGNSGDVSGMKRIWATTTQAGIFPSATQIKADVSTACTGQGSCSLSLSKSLQSGQHSVHYVASDDAGNEVLGTLNFTVAVDLEAPRSTAPSFTRTIVSESNAQLTWQATNDNHSGISSYLLEIVDLDQNTSTTVSTSGTWWNLTNLDEGNYSACLTVRDNVGHTSQQACTPQNLLVDTSAPVIDSSINLSGWVSGTSDVSVNWMVEDSSGGGLIVRYRLDSGNYSSPQPSNGSKNFTSLPDGWHTIQIMATDGAGNQYVATHRFGLDNQAPTVSLSSSIGSGWSNAQRQAIHWTVADSNSGSGLDLIVLLVNNVSEGTVGSTGQRVLELGSGVHTVEVVAMDRAGNSRTYPLTLRIDHATPIANCSVAPEAWTNGALTLNVQPDSNGSISPVDWTFHINGVEDKSATTGTNFRNLPNGVHVFKLHVWNSAGSDHVCQAVGRVDKSAPVYIAQQLPPSFIKGNQTSLVVEAVDIGDAGLNSFSASIDGTVAQNGTYENGRYVFDLHNFTDGPHQFTFHITDHAGNTRALSKTITLDRQRPSIEQFSVLNSQNQGWISESILSIAWSASDNLASNLNATILLNGAQLTTESSLSPLQILVPNGIHNLTLRVADEAGNVEFTSLVVNVDNSVPECSFEPSIGTEWTTSKSVSIAPMCQPQVSLVNVTAKLNGGPKMLMAESSVFNLVHGRNTVEIQARSEAGLEERTLLSFNSDHYAPSASISLPSSAFLDEYANGDVQLSYLVNFDDGSPFNYDLYLNERKIAEGSNLVNEFSRDHLLRNLENGRYDVRLNVTDSAGHTFDVNESFTVVRDSTPMEIQCRTSQGKVLDFDLEGETSAFVQVIPQDRVGNGDFVCNADDATSTLNLSSGFGSVVILIDGEEVKNVFKDRNAFKFQHEKFSDNDFTGYTNLTILSVDRWGNQGSTTSTFFTKHTEHSIARRNGGVQTASFGQENSLLLNFDFMLTGFHADEDPEIDAHIQWGSSGAWTPALKATKLTPLATEPGGKLIVTFAANISDVNLLGSMESNVSINVTAHDNFIAPISEVFSYNLNLCTADGLAVQVQTTDLNSTISCIAVRYIGPAVADQYLSVRDVRNASVMLIDHEGDPWRTPTDCILDIKDDWLRATIENSHMLEIALEQSVKPSNIKATITLNCTDIHGLMNTTQLEVSFAFTPPEPSFIEKHSLALSVTVPLLSALFLGLLLFSRAKRNMAPLEVEIILGTSKDQRMEMEVADVE
jgi:hypothetical protein